jgi:hypothetical protein
MSVEVHYAATRLRFRKMDRRHGGSRRVARQHFAGLGTYRTSRPSTDPPGERATPIDTPRGRRNRRTNERDGDGPMEPLHREPPARSSQRRERMGMNERGGPGETCSADLHRDAQAIQGKEDQRRTRRGIDEPSTSERGNPSKSSSPSRIVTASETRSGKQLPPSAN